MALTLHGIEFLLILELDPDPLAAPDYRRTVQPLHRQDGIGCLIEGYKAVAFMWHNLHRLDLASEL